MSDKQANGYHETGKAFADKYLIDLNVLCLTGICEQESGKSRVEAKSVN
ncbi:hypothetical protein [Candidatus Scalindua japonica]|nr:hypothetical protein [Candidatus Scalindua japonica]